MALAAVMVIGCGGSPTRPGDTGNPGGANPGNPQPTPGPHIVSGSVTSAADGAAAGTVSFTVGGTLVGRSDAAGNFSVGFPATGANRTSITATGFVERQTNIAAPGGGRQLSLIPSTFDLAAFDQMFRHAQVGGTGPGLTRWKTPPGLVIERRVLQFTDTGATSYQALDETLTQQEVDSVLSDLLAGYDLLTAGRLGPVASVSTQEAAAGATVTPRQDGRIVVTRQEGLSRLSDGHYWGYARWSTNADGEVTSGWIILDRDFERGASPYHRSLRMHELGHTLGCQHVTLRSSVMNSAATIEPNTFDRQAARIAMLRPTGNRTPDIDPASHIASTVTRTSQSLTWHGAH